MPLKNISVPGNNTLIIQQAGDYEINYNLLLNTTVSANMAAMIRKNGDIIPATQISQNLASDNAGKLSYDGRLCVSAIASLNAGDILDVALAVVRLLPAEFDAVINSNGNATFTVKKLNP